MSATSATVASRRTPVPIAIGHTLTIARRNLLHIRSDPEQMVGMTIQPLMFLVLFVYVFGGAIAGSSREYLQFALPGIMVQGISFGGFTTALGLNVDFQRGLIERFRSLPIARSAVVAGRILADTLRIVWGVLIIYGFGVLLGFRFTGGLGGAIGAVAAVTVFGFGLSWVMAYIGVLAHTPEAVNTWGFLVILPFSFGSSVFAPVETMPGWLQAFVKVNPFTHIVDLTRALMLGGEIGRSLLWTLVWIVVLIAVFAPLTVARYRRRI